MATRMHCADCRTTDFADTRLGGSDHLECLGWALGGLAGWLYCAWRFVLRDKRCAHCGSPELLRESRAACERASWPVPPHFGPRFAHSPGALPWPSALRDPRQRLRLGLPGLAAWALVAAGHGLGGVVLGAVWLGALALLAGRHPARAAGCRAWDAAGRSLRVEWA